MSIYIINNQNTLNYETIISTSVPTFSTKNRNPFITEEIENELFAYIGGIINMMLNTMKNIYGNNSLIFRPCKTWEKGWHFIHRASLRLPYAKIF